MKYFERFAEYAVFRDLYNKTVPIVQKIQETLRQYEVENKKTNIIIERIDLNLTDKASKN